MSDEPSNGELMRVLRGVEGEVRAQRGELVAFRTDFHARISVLEDRSKRLDDARAQRPEDDRPGPASGGGRKWLAIGTWIGTGIGSGLAYFLSNVLGGGGKTQP